MMTVCEWFGLKTTQTVFTGLASKLVVMVSSGLTSKSAMTVFSGLTSKLVATVFSSLASELVATVFSSLASKQVVTVSPGLAAKPVVGFLVEPQNQGGGGFPGLSLKTGNLGLVIWTSKAVRRFFGLCLKTMWARFVGCTTKPTEGGRRGTRIEI
jgi:hypothetical protein